MGNFKDNNNENLNMNDSLDDSISRSLRRLGFIFPKTNEDFGKIENRVDNSQIMRPDCLSDPYKFLGKEFHNLKIKPINEK